MGSPRLVRLRKGPGEFDHTQTNLIILKRKIVPVIVLHAMIVIVLGGTARLLAAGWTTSSTGVGWTAACAAAHTAVATAAWVWWGATVSHCMGAAAAMATSIASASEAAHCRIWFNRTCAPTPSIILTSSPFSAASLSSTFWSTSFLFSLLLKNSKENSQGMFLFRITRWSSDNDVATRNQRWNSKECSQEPPPFLLSLSPWSSSDLWECDSNIGFNFQPNQNLQDKNSCRLWFLVSHQYHWPLLPLQPTAQWEND